MTRRKHTPQSDELIERMFEKYGSRWKKIALELGNGWTEDAVRNRIVRLYTSRGHVIEPTVNRRPPKKPDSKRLWTPEEDSKLLDLMNKGVGIVELCPHFPQRKRQSIRNRRYRLMNAKIGNFNIFVDDNDDQERDLSYMLSCIQHVCEEEG